MQMKGKREFPPDVPSSGDVLSHLSESGMSLLSLLLNIRDHLMKTFLVWSEPNLLSEICLGLVLYLQTRN